MGSRKVITLQVTWFFLIVDNVLFSYILSRTRTTKHFVVNCLLTDFTDNLSKCFSPQNSIQLACEK